MYLKRITITGFKSFASKTVLNLEHGITAVVGPNGSGKSNIADAIRWALGEQSKGRLRLADREEVVFAGTERRSRASLAEVVLLFDNQDGAFPVELTEVEISRRLYRSGETDYRLAGRSVRLSDIQQLLAEAGFGANSYAVIGQGMIDNLLLSSPTERKLLFDEAAGIRGAELRREGALRKLAATAANVTRLRDINTELEPRLALLRRSVAAAEEQQALLAQRDELRAAYLAAGVNQNTSAQQALGVEAAELSRQLHRWRHDRQTLAAAQTKRLQAAAATELARTANRERLQLLETDRSRRLEAVAELRGHHEQLTQALDRLPEVRRRAAAIATDLEAAELRAADLLEQLGANQAAAERASRAVDRADQVVTKVQAELVEIRQSTTDGTQQQYVAHALEILKTLARGLADESASTEQLRLLVHKAGRLLSHATKTSEAELLRRLREAQTRLEAAMTRRETAVEHQTNIIITGRSLEIDLAHQQAAIEALRDKHADVQQEVERLDHQREQAATLARQIDAAKRALTKLEAELARRRAEFEAGAAAVDTAAVAQAATQLERLRLRQTEAEARQCGVRQELATLQAQRRQLAERAAAWRLEPPAATTAVAAAADPAALDHRLTQLDASLAAREQLNHDTAIEYAEVNQRAADLAAQIVDLEQAEADLRRIVTELDQLIRERFKQNFQALAGQFSAYFTRLFGGGAASLELEEQPDGAYGILIKATPKGKRPVSLSALSGGERAMAGVALLAAILSVNPSPFIVLDEIDAALDEANSGRLADILAELADRSQLIVITHNRQTMKAAKVLFGVTMNSHHVSHLLSLQLDEASALAAR
ncbi:MAG TPA: AAA family ATPase [Candidatus Saccharimonadia bacterium]|nr:AAA family ATPase [Candidatus Saccharimonadia bacterium]